jgi:DNA invertase Pin-like site-specific DNA recombinase/sporulation protein YlmC with PRC-barrel domain
MKQLHIYLRVSTESQVTDGFGIENQRELGLSVSERLGLEPVIYDEGSSSSHLETIDHRPKLTELLLRIEEGLVQNLWVYQMDRLSRNDVVSFQIRQILKKHNVKLYVGSQNDYDLDNPSDKLMFTIMEGLSEFDNAIRTERLRRGKLSKIKKGGWKGGPPPFGYELVDGRLSVHKEESKWVRFIFDEYSKGRTIYQIRKSLMENAVLSRRGNVVWNENSIKKILSNTHYGGYYTYTDKKLQQTIVCDVPTIIDKTLLSEVSFRLKHLKKSSNYIKTTTLLKDFLVCGHCGHNFGQRINRSQYHSHYYCRGNENHKRNGPIDGKKICTTNSTQTGRVRSISIEETDQLVWNQIVDVLNNSHIFKEQFKDEVMGSSQTHQVSDQERKRIQKRIKKIEKDLSDVNEVKTSDTIQRLIATKSKEEFDKLSTQFDIQKREYEVELGELHEQLLSIETNKKWVNWVNQYKDQIRNLRNAEMSVEARKDFLDAILDKVIVTTVDKQTHQLEIHFRSPIVSDTFTWNEKGNPQKGYEIGDGQTDIVFTMDSGDRRKKTLI